MRLRKINASATALRKHTRREIIYCQDDVKLEAWITLQPDGKNQKSPLIIIFHGWLGSAESSDVIDAAQCFFAAGYSVARLNLRDHGDTHHLNKQVFHSARLQETVDATSRLMNLTGTQNTTLLGFSLGGNFALRISASLGLHPHLNNTIAVCPLIDPGPAMQSIDEGWFIYQRHFVNKWRQSMLDKQRAFPHYNFSEELKLKSVSSLTDIFVRRSTPYENSEDYFSAYSISANRLKGITTPAHIIAAKDDPVIPHASFTQLIEDEKRNPNLHLHMQNNGGHCGFIADWKLNSWLNSAVLELLEHKP
ncbi:MAG: alpha/beta fold hydrolase [Pseudomonadales bacterium]|nr:alpha/beta fold hydrolase [Pseudomonadales bacterium]